MAPSLKDSDAAATLLPLTDTEKAQAQRPNASLSDRDPCRDIFIFVMMCVAKTYLYTAVIMLASFVVGGLWDAVLTGYLGSLLNAMFGCAAGLLGYLLALVTLLCILLCITFWLNARPPTATDLARLALCGSLICVLGLGMMGMLWLNDTVACNASKEVRVVVGADYPYGSVRATVYFEQSPLQTVMMVPHPDLVLHHWHVGSNASTAALKWRHDADPVLLFDFRTGTAHSTAHGSESGSHATFSPDGAMNITFAPHTPDSSTVEIPADTPVLRRIWTAKRRGVLNVCAAKSELEDPNSVQRVLYPLGLLMHQFTESSKPRGV